jgi:hypothetical protein
MTMGVEEKVAMGACLFVDVGLERKSEDWRVASFDRPRKKSRNSRIGKNDQKARKAEQYSVVERCPP